MARKTPLCLKCGKEHWNYTACGEKKPPPHILRHPREDGLSDWGDRLIDYDRQGDTLLLKDQKNIDRGLLTGPEGWSPPEAA